MAAARGGFVIAAALAGAAASSVWAWRTAHAPLNAPVEQAIARALHVERSRVHVARAELRAPARLVIERVELPSPLERLSGVKGAAHGPVTVAAIELDVNAGAALAGRPRLERARAREISFSENNFSGRVADVEATFGSGGRARVYARGLDGKRGSVRVAAGGLSVEISGGRVERAAATAVELDKLGGLTALAWRDGATWRWRAAGPGLDASGSFEGGALDGKLKLDRFPLAPAATRLQPSGLDTTRALASGEIDLHELRGAVRARGQLRVDELSVEQPALARRRLGPVSLVLDGEAAWARPLLSAESLHVTLGPLDARVTGWLDPAQEFEAHVELAQVSCAEALRALPGDLLPALDGLTLDGKLGGSLRLAGEIDRLSDLALDAKLDVGCRVLDDPPLADPTSLKRPVVAKVGEGRPVVLGPQNPNFRPLASLPERVVRAFVLAEDGRFFQHRGFDLDMIRHALAQDLRDHRFERGASTITQQVAKNIFLSGERTAARKLEEAVLAWRMEQVLSKRRILELYLNLAELGPDVYGLAEAAEKYFGKEPEELTSDEAAQLAALLPAPRRGMDAAWERRYKALARRLPSEKLTITLR